MKLKEECGIFGGISFDGDISPIIRDGLFRLQHRGQENAGICCGDEKLDIYKGNGLVLEVLTDSIISKMKGKSGIGHVRYSTQGVSDVLHAQPFMVKYLDEEVSIAHNGNTSAAIEMRKELEKQGEVFLTSSDTEMVFKKVIREMCKPPSQWLFEEIGDILKDNFTGGAWSILFGFPGKVMAFRDPLGFRPLMFCEAEEGYFVASEDCAFQLLKVKKIIELQPGEGIEIHSGGYSIKRFAEVRPAKQCVFEHIYFSKPYSNIFGRSVYQTRIMLGAKIAEESPVEADIVVPVMDSGFVPALGYSQKSGIPLHMGLMRNHWTGRTFIQPDQQARKKGVLRKLAPIASVIEGKRVILVDDSIVRGTTSREIVKMLQEAGAKEVHFRLASPKIISTCSWGVDIPTKSELIANKFESTEEIRQFIEADSLAYLSLESLQDIFGKQDWCYYCFNTKKYICDDYKETLEGKGLKLSCCL
jgi:amidophosphoribosyltransferase